MPMPIKDLRRLEDANLEPELSRRDLSLWVLPDTAADDLIPVLNLPWVNIWNAAPGIDILGKL